MRLPLDRSLLARGWARRALPFIPFILAVSLRLLLEPVLEDKSPFLLFSLAVVASSIYGGTRPTLITTVLGGAAGVWFVAHPSSGEPIVELSRVIQIAIYFGVCGGISYLIGALCRAQSQVEAYAQEQSRLAEALRAADQAKDRFLAAVSHDLRTPLNAILGWAHLLRDGSLDPAQSAKALETIERSAVAQNQLISDLLDVSRIVEGRLRLRPRTIDPAAIARDVISIFDPAARTKGVSLELQASPAGGLRADPDRIQQVLWNLVSNALRHTPAGGRVVLSVSAAAADIIFGVRDTGPGIDPELLPYVFDRFRQGTNTKGGLGLGLTISRHIVALHGGTISAQNEHDPPGARFEVRLPSDEGG